MARPHLVIRLRRQLLWLLIGVALSMGCTPEPPFSLRVGLNAWPGYEFLYLAQEKGFFREAGLEVRLVEFSSLSDCRRAYERGQINAMGTTVIEVLMVYDQSHRSPQIVRVLDYSDGADVIVTRAGLTNGASLGNARIGVELASLGVYILARGLEKNGLTLAQVNPVSMDQLSMEAAFRRGDLDGVVTYPPVSVKLLRETNAHSFFSTAEIPGEVVDVLAVEAEVSLQQPGAVAQFLHAFGRAVTYAQANPADAYQIMAAREQLTPEEFTQALASGVKILSEADQAAFFRAGGKLESVIETSDRILRQSGQINGPHRRRQIVNSAFVNSAFVKPAAAP
jgi:NitT/TauT family transport system substrate-binding protein